jgi:hypothetical protein
VLAVPHPARYQKAKTLYASAERLGEGAEASERGTVLARFDLYREAARAALASVNEREAADLETLRMLLPGTPESALQRMAGTVATDEQLEDAALPQALTDLRAVATAALGVVEAPEAAMTGRVQRQVVRSAVTFLVVLALLPAAAGGVSHLFQPTDLAKGRPWRASSKLADCHPEQIECGGVRTPIFFHTLQENEPWVEFDLGPGAQFSSVHVYNRSDGWGDRTFPLQLEVGDDQKTWRPIIKSPSDEMKVWKAEFPTTTARFVRLRALRNTLLHLDSVRIYR